MRLRLNAPDQGPRRAQGRGERGETLIEIMATVILMGLAIVAVLTMIFLAVRVTGSYRKTTRASTQAIDFAEDLLRTDNGTTYEPCQTANPSAAPGYHYTHEQNGYTVSVAKVEFLVSKTTTTPTWQSTCPATGDQGLQRLHLKVVSPADVQEEETVTVIKRNRTCTNSTGEQC